METSSKLDNEVTRPQHYQPGSPFEPIKIIEHYGLDFCLGNAVKYILRAGLKDSETTESDLAKAAWYTNRASEALQQPQSTSEKRFKKLADLYDEDSYLVGMNDAAGSPSKVLRAVIFALLESDFEEIFVPERDLDAATVSKGLEIERVEHDGQSGFLIKVEHFAPLARVNDMVLDGEVVETEPVSRVEPYQGDPGDEHWD